MSGEGIYIRDDEGSSFFPCSATNSSSTADAGAGDGTLEWPEREPLAIFDEVEAHPEEPKRFAQSRRCVGQGGDEIGFTLDEEAIVVDEMLVSLGLGERRVVGEALFHIILGVGSY